MTISCINMRIETLDDLRFFLSEFPDGTTADILASDLEAGNFDKAVISNRLYDFHVTYTGPVVEGYVSPHDQRAEYADALRKLGWD